MNKDCLYYKRTRQAFTLIELMLVVIIIAVLAGMVMPRFFGRTEQARIAAAKGDIASISNAIGLFEVDTGHYPQALKDLRTDPGITGWKGPYVQKEPKDPWGRDYEYAPQAQEASDYKLCSKGPDESKAEDDVCN